MKNHAEKNMILKSQERAKKLAKSTAKNAKRTAKATIKAVKAAIASEKALISAIISAGWISIIVIIICGLFGTAFYFFGDESSKSYEPVTPQVEAYTAVIEKYASRRRHR